MVTPQREPVSLAADGLVLRELLEADHADLISSSADPDIRLWNPQLVGDQDVAEFVRARNDWSGGTHVSWAIAEPGPAGRLVGYVSLHHIDDDNENAEIGYWTAPWARRRGYAVRAVRAAVTFGFETVGLVRIQLFHAAENEGSCRVAQATGFLLEGISRQSHRFGDGLLHDEHLHARLRTD